METDSPVFQLNKSKHHQYQIVQTISKNDKVGTSLSAKKLKLNLDSQSSWNDSIVDGSVNDINVDLESSEDDIDITDNDYCHSSNFYERRDTSC